MAQAKEKRIKQKNAFHEIWTLLSRIIFEGYAFMIVIEFYKLYFVFTVRAFQWVVAEGTENGSSLLIKTTEDRMLALGYNPMELGTNLTGSRKNTDTLAVTDW